MHFRRLAFVVSVLWIILALITLGSLVLDTSLWVFNVIAGLVFFLIGFFLLLKANVTNQLIEDIKRKLDSDETTEFSLRDFIVLQAISNIILLFIIVVLLLAACSRVFWEGFPVFG